MPRAAEPEPSPASHSASGSANGLEKLLCRSLVVIGVAALAGITLVNPGATRMHAWPWSLLYAAALTVPALILIWRAFQRTRPLAPPTVGWNAALLLAFMGTLASALASPHRGPSVLWSAPLLAGIATFFVIYDWLHAEAGQSTARRERLLLAAGIFFAPVAVVSLVLWLNSLPGFGRGNLLVYRNAFPLGHSNYTAGLALLMLPCFVALAVRANGRLRLAWSFAGVLAIAMLFTSGSRGGILGLAALALWQVRAVARMFRIRLSVVLLGGALLLAAFVYWNPRTRAALAGDELRISDVQRTAMLAAAKHMGADRPLLGWGPGTTPLVYPRYRAALSGGAETVLQLHSTPAQLWAELGGVNLLLALLVALFAVSAAFRSKFGAHVLAGLSGYAVFSLTDWQLDVPVFATAIAAGLALLAPAAAVANTEARVIRQFAWGNRLFSIKWREDDAAKRRLLGLVTLLALVILAIFARRDPAPELNVRALRLATDPAKAGEAVALLRESLRLNRDQEIAHFNLGWLLVVSEPAIAEEHFLAAARLVPDKGGVYFGLGLARLNQNRKDDAARAFALECLNDPAFLVSPWWRVTSLRETRTNTLARLVQSQSLVLQTLPEKSPLRAEAQYARELALWIGTGAPVVHPNTPERTAFFAKNPAVPDFENTPLFAYRRERTGYPVLMRNLDLPVPVDLFDVQENSLANGEDRFLFPQKGWLASPLLPALLLQSETHPK